MNELITPDVLSPVVLDVLTEYARAGAAGAAAAMATTAGRKLIGWLKEKGDAVFGALLDKFLKSPEANRRSLEERLNQCLKGLPRNSLDELAGLVKAIRPDVSFAPVTLLSKIKDSAGATSVQAHGNDIKINIR